MLNLAVSFPAMGDKCMVVGRPGSRWPTVCAARAIPFEPCSFGGDLSPWVVPRLRAICKRFEPDVSVIKGFRQARFLKRAWPAAVTAVKLPASNELTNGLSDRLTFRYAVDLILVDNYKAQLAFRSIPWVPSGKIAAIHNGVDIPESSIIPTSRPWLHRFLQVDDQALIIGASGRLSQGKAFDDAIRALSALGRKDTHLVIFGDGPELAELQSLARHFNLADHVHFPGWHDDARRLLWGCDVFLHPSLSEGLPNTVLESMAGGVPVIATNAGGTAEIFTGALADYLTELRDVNGMSARLARLLDDAPLRLHIGRLARAHVQDNFSIQAMTTGIRNVLQGALRGNPPDPAS